MKDHVFFRRVVALGLVLAVVLGGYVYQLMQIQIVNGEENARRARRSTVKTQTIKAARGEIVDRYGRPLAVNRQGFDIIFDKAFLPKGEENQILVRLLTMMDDLGQQWIDNLPITKEAPFAFLQGDATLSEDKYEKAIARVKEFTQVQDWTSAEDVLFWLVDRYELEDYPAEVQRKLAGVRYEMEQRGFSITVPYTFASDVDIPVVTKVKEHSFELPGVDVVENPVREYVAGDLFPHIIGTIGPMYAEDFEKYSAEEYKDRHYQMNDTIGKMGVEARFEDQLRGTDGTRLITLDHNGRVTDVQEGTPAVPGNTVMLSLDSRLQRASQDAVEKEIKFLQQTAPEGRGKEANAGAAVAIEIETGDILACATYPSYDINEYNSNYEALVENDLRPLYNRALLGLYAAGSIFKPAVGLAGLSEEVVTSEELIHCSGIYTYWGEGPEDYKPTCLSAHGNMDVTNALRVSCNIFFYETGRRLGIERINKYAGQLGLGQSTGVELPESRGHLSSPEAAEANGMDWQEGDVVQSAIGQSFNQFTPVQLANYAATLARRGTRMEAHLVKSVKDYTFANAVWDSKPTVADRVDAPPEAFDEVIRGMELSAGPTGTSYSYWGGEYPYRVASKTGTPQTKEFPNSTFICFLPADAPKIAIAVVIEKGWHGYTGAPVARKIADAYFFGGEESVAPQPSGQLLP